MFFDHDFFEDVDMLPDKLLKSSGEKRKRNTHAAAERKRRELISSHEKRMAANLGMANSTRAEVMDAANSFIENAPKSQDLLDRYAKRIEAAFESSLVTAVQRCVDQVVVATVNRERMAAQFNALEHENGQLQEQNAVLKKQVERMKSLRSS